MISPSAHLHSRPKSAFTLMEMLAVMAVIVIILAVSYPVITPMLQATNLTQASSMIVDELNQARQFALTRNRDVEVRFYQMKGKANPDQAYRAFRIFIRDSDGTLKAFGKVKYLPDTMIISDKAQYSTLLDFGNSNRSGISQGNETLPGDSTSTSYTSFTFRANGGTTLAPVTPPTGVWFLTIHRENSGATELPKNYSNILLDPVTGRTRIYRP